MMPKKHILLVEKEPQNRRLLEVSLTKAGFEVDVATSMSEALAKADVQHPNLVISGTELDGSSGFDLCTEFRNRTALSGAPFVFLSEDSSVASKVRGLELGADDYLVRPVYIKDLVSRMEILMAQRQREQVHTNQSEPETMQGDLSSISLVEMMQAMAAGRKDGTARVDGTESRGTIWFLNGQVIDASVDNLQGESALFRMMRWDQGHFEIEFQTPERIVAIRRSIEELINEALNQTELWIQLSEQLPDLSTVCQVNFDELAQRLSELPDSHTALIRHIDGEKTILEVVRSSTLSDVDALNIFNQLFFEGLVNDSGISRQKVTVPPADLTLTNLADAVVDAIADVEPVQSTPPPHEVTPAPVVEESDNTASHTDSASSNTIEVTAELTGAIDNEEIEAFEPPPEPEPPQPEPESPESAVMPAPEQSFWDLSDSTREDGQAYASAGADFGHINHQNDEFPSMQGVSVTDASDEDDFFDSNTHSASFDDDGFSLEDEEVVPPGGSKKIALILLACLVPAVIYIFARDRVKPMDFSPRDLNDKWAESAVRNLPPVAKSVELDAGWNIPSLSDAGLLPAAPGSEDTYSQTRQNNTEEELEEPSSEQVAMKPVETTAETPKSIEAGNTATPEQRKKAAGLLKNSEEQIAKEAFKNAAQFLEQSLALDPSNLKALRLNALVHVELDRMEDGIEFALKAIRLGATVDDTTELYQLLGQAYQSLGRIKEARTAYETFLKVAPKSKNPQTKQAVQYIQQLLGSLNEEG
jgi:CheY-like chemotaxis protein/Flp pilus assembly protein TadD